MISASSRKKPVCQKCGLPMAGHKRPYGVSVCPRDDSAPSSSQTAGAVPQIVPPVDVSPTASGYWEHRRPNQNWFDPPYYAKQTHPNVVFERGPSWVSTERDGSSQGTLSPRQLSRSPPSVREVIDVDADDEIEEAKHRSAWSQEPEPGDEQYEPSEPAEDGYGSDTSSKRSSAAVIVKRASRRFASVVARAAPLASLYASPRSQVSVIRTAAQAEGLYTGVMHFDRDPSAEAAGFKLKEELATPVRTFPAREGSSIIAVGRDQGAVNALIESAASPPRARPGMRPQPGPNGMLEPYDCGRGLNVNRECNNSERVGSYPEGSNPRRTRNTIFVMIMVAGAVGGLVESAVGPGGLVVLAMGGLVVFYGLSAVQ